MKIILLSIFIIFPHQAFSKEKNFIICCAELMKDYDYTKYFQKLLSDSYKRLNISVTYMYFPLKRSLLEGNVGDICDAELLRVGGISKKYENLIQIKASFKPISHHLFKKSEVVMTKDLNQYRIGYLKGAEVFKRLAQGNKNYIGLKSHKQAIEMIVKNRIDLMIISDAFIGKKYMHNKHLELYKKNFLVTPMFHYISSKHKSVVPRLTRSIQYILKNR